MADKQGHIGDAGVETVVRMGCRREGVTVPEVQDLYGVSYWSARRFLQRLVRDDKLYQTERKRRRIEVHGVNGPGAPCVVYRAKMEARRWVSSLNLQAQRRSRVASR